MLIQQKSDLVFQGGASVIRRSLTTSAVGENYLDESGGGAASFGPNGYAWSSLILGVGC
jgi:hypothetical protein